MSIKEVIHWMLPAKGCRRRKCFSPCATPNRGDHVFRANGELDYTNPNSTSPITFRRIWKSCYNDINWPRTECREMDARNPTYKRGKVVAHGSK